MVLLPWNWHGSDNIGNCLMFLPKTLGLKFSPAIIIWQSKQGKYRMNKESRFKTKLDIIFYLVSNTNMFLRIKDLSNILSEL